MRQKHLYNIIVAWFIILGIGISSCIKKPKYPSTPVIKFKDFIRYGNPADPDSVELVITFTDSEGDIGLDPEDKKGILKDGNLFMIYFYDSAGTWAAFDPNPLPPFDTLRIVYPVPPVLPPNDLNEPVKGSIYVKQFKPFRAHNKIKYVVYMYDKALHKSDTIHTPVLTFP
jgi:hypothetical protein